MGSGTRGRRSASSAKYVSFGFRASRTRLRFRRHPGIYTSSNLAAADVLEASPLAGAALGGMPPPARSTLSGRPWITDRPESRSGGWPALPGPGQVPTFGRRPPPAPLPLGAPHHRRERRMYRTIFLQLSRGEAGRAHGLRTWARPCREAAPPASPRSLIGEARSGREAPRGSSLVVARHDRASMRRRSASPRNHSPATARAR